jgi:hypothetical protein
MSDETTILHARIVALERLAADTEIGAFGLMDQRDAALKMADALRTELNALKLEMKRKDELHERTDVEFLKRQIEEHKRLRVKQMAENERLKSDLQKLAQSDRDDEHDKARLLSAHREETCALRRRIGSLEAIDQRDCKDRVLFQEALRQHEVLKRRVRELEQPDQPSTFDALSRVASVMSRASRWCNAKDADDLREQTDELVRLTVAGSGLSAGELKRQQDSIASCFFKAFSRAVMGQIDDRVEELKKRRVP